MIQIYPPKSKRRIVREKCLQVLYAYYFKSEGIDQLFDSVFHDITQPAEREFARSLVDRVIINWKKFDLELEITVTNWVIERIAITDLIIIKMGMAEINFFSDIPPKVTINECIDLTKEFSTESSGKFVNGILDKYLEKIKAGDLLNKTGRGTLDTPKGKDRNAKRQ